MPRFRALIASVALLTATLAFAGGALADSSCYRFSGDDRKLFELTNATRGYNKVGLLRLDAETSRVAKAHTKAMIRKGNLFHSSAEQLGGRVTKWTVVGEAVGRAKSVAVLHRRLVKQPAHRFLMLHPQMQHVGMGVVKKGSDYYGTVVLSSGDNPGTKMKMPRC